MNRTMIVLRTHAVDPELIQVAQQLRRPSRCQLALVLDESNGPLDAQGFPKDSLTQGHCDGLASASGMIMTAQRPVMNAVRVKAKLRDVLKPGRERWRMIAAEGAGSRFSQVRQMS